MKVNQTSSSADGVLSLFLFPQFSVGLVEKNIIYKSMKHNRKVYFKHINP